MVHHVRYTTLVESSDDELLAAILTQCFISPPGAESTYLKRIGREQFRIVYHHTALAGGLALIPMGQWWGGRRVPMVGVAAVGIAPEHRGSGVAGAMMKEAIAELHGQNVPISVLYPAVQRLYRKVGYEQAGTFCRWVVDTHHLPATAPPLPIEPLSLDDLDNIQALQRQQGQGHNGHLDRHRALWLEITQTDAPPADRTVLHAYRLGAQTDPQGYIIFSQARTPQGAVLTLKDWAVLTPEAIATFWALLASHGSQIDQISWQSAPLDSLSVALPEQDAKLISMKRWMLRVVSVQPALEQRGYPITAQGELHLKIEDDLLPGNRGCFVLSVAQGKGQVTPGGHGTFELGIRALASLYTGFLSPVQLQRLGLLQAPDEAIAFATHCFAGEPPWMPDFF